MSASNGATVPDETNQAAQATFEKGKGKAGEEPVDQSMDEDSDDDEEVSCFPLCSGPIGVASLILTTFVSTAGWRW